MSGLSSRDGNSTSGCASLISHYGGSLSIYLTGSGSQRIEPYYPSLGALAHSRKRKRDSNSGESDSKKKKIVLETTFIDSSDEDEDVELGECKPTPKRYFPIKLCESNNTVWLPQNEHEAFQKLLDYSEKHGIGLKELYEHIVEHYK